MSKERMKGIQYVTGIADICQTLDDGICKAFRGALNAGFDVDSALAVIIERLRYVLEDIAEGVSKEGEIARLVASIREEDEQTAGEEADKEDQE